MYLHEFQAKNILKLNNLLVPKSLLIINKNQTKTILANFDNEKIVLKAQIHAGARGKFGGIRIINNKYEDIEKNLQSLIHSYLVTDQTDKKGKKINHVLIEELIKIEKEFYISFYIDRETDSLTILTSKTGGSKIEKNLNSEFIKIKLDLDQEIYNYQIRNIIYFWKIDFKYFEKIKNIVTTCFNIFKRHDLILLEINPLALSDDNFYCIDAKFEFDDNSCYRNSLFKEYDYEQEDSIELEAKKLNLNYISLNGNVGCMVNGAGLAMATMDLLKFNKINPSNFLDIGGNATEETIINAFKILKLNNNLKCIFINIFGGIVRCDIIAKTIIKILNNKNYYIPIITRFAGNMSKEAIEIIQKENLNITAKTNLEDSINNLIKIIGV